MLFRLAHATDADRYPFHLCKLAVAACCGCGHVRTGSCAGISIRPRLIGSYAGHTCTCFSDSCIQSIPGARLACIAQRMSSHCVAHHSFHGVQHTIIRGPIRQSSEYPVYGVSQSPQGSCHHTLGRIQITNYGCDSFCHFAYVVKLKADWPVGHSNSADWVDSGHPGDTAPSHHLLRAHSIVDGPSSG